jgi:hypothetical protein
LLQFIFALQQKGLSVCVSVSLGSVVVVVSMPLADFSQDLWLEMISEACLFFTSAFV